MGRKYYWAVVLVSMRWWFTQDQSNPVINLEAAILGSYSELSNLVYRGPRLNPHTTTPMNTTVMVWKRISMTWPGKFSSYTPLWGNQFLPHLRTIPDPQLWTRYGVRTLRDIMPVSHLLTFASSLMYFR